jgi:hypothetical protein
VSGVDTITVNLGEQVIVAERGGWLSAAAGGFGAAVAGLAAAGAAAAVAPD